MPPERGRPFWMSSRRPKPAGAPARRSTEAAAIAAVLRAGSTGILGSETDPTRTPGGFVGRGGDPVAAAREGDAEAVEARPQVGGGAGSVDADLLQGAKL